MIIETVNVVNRDWLVFFFLLLGCGKFILDIMDTILQWWEERRDKEINR
jgi:hypothetical protein